MSAEMERRTDEWAAEVRREMAAEVLAEQLSGDALRALVVILDRAGGIIGDDIADAHELAIVFEHHEDRDRALYALRRLRLVFHNADAWPPTPYCHGQRAALGGFDRMTPPGYTGGTCDGGAGEWYAGYDDAMRGRIYNTGRA